MNKRELDELLHTKDLTQSEYDSFFETMSENKKGEMIGVIPSGHVSDIYNFNGDMFNNTYEFVLKHIQPPLGAERFGTCFSQYGYTMCGICDGWKWFTEDNINDTALSHGYRPLSEATEEELWKIIAISSRYWETFYYRKYKYNTKKGE